MFPRAVLSHRCAGSRQDFSPALRPSSPRTSWSCLFGGGSQRQLPLPPNHFTAGNSPLPRSRQISCMSKKKRPDFRERGLLVGSPPDGRHPVVRSLVSGQRGVRDYGCWGATGVTMTHSSGTSEASFSCFSYSRPLGSWVPAVGANTYGSDQIGPGLFRRRHDPSQDLRTGRGDADTLIPGPKDLPYVFRSSGYAGKYNRIIIIYGLGTRKPFAILGVYNNTAGRETEGWGKTVSKEPDGEHLV